MKRKIITLLLIVALIFTKGMNVLADGEPTDSSYEHNGYTYIIDGFELDVYQMDYEYEDDVDPEDEDEVEPMVTDESYAKYLNNQPTRVIAIPADSLTFSPTYHEETIDGKDFTVIDLGVTISEDTLKALLQTELASLTTTKDYHVNLVVNYKMSAAPNTHTKFYTLNELKETYRYFNELLEEKENIEEVERQEAALNEANKQVISSFIVDNTEILGYTKDAEEVEILELFSYFIFTDAEDTEENTRYFMFSNVDNTTELADRITGGIESLNAVINGSDEEDDDDLINPETGTDGSQKVEVEDTLMNVPIGYFAAGVLSIAVGTIIIFYIVNKKSTKKTEQQ